MRNWDLVGADELATAPRDDQWQKCTQNWLEAPIQALSRLTASLPAESPRRCQTKLTESRYASLMKLLMLGRGFFFFLIFDKLGAAKSSFWCPLKKKKDMSCQLVKNNSLWAVWTWLLYALPPWKLLVWEGIMPPSCWNTLLAREPLRVGPVLSSQWWWDCSSIPSNTQQVSVNQLVRERVCKERNTQTPEQILVFVLWAWYLPSLLLTTEPNWAKLSQSLRLPGWALLCTASGEQN